MDKAEFMERCERLYDNFREIEAMPDFEPDEAGTSIIFNFEGRAMVLGFNPQTSPKRSETDQ